MPANESMIQKRFGIRNASNFHSGKQASYSVSEDMKLRLETAFVIFTKQILQQIAFAFKFLKSPIQKSF